jgi:hypothetical protein
MAVSTGKKLLEDSKEFSFNPCRILSANEFAPTEKSNFTKTGYTHIAFAGFLSYDQFMSWWHACHNTNPIRVSAALKFLNENCSPSGRGWGRER